MEQTIDYTTNSPHPDALTALLNEAPIAVPPPQSIDEVQRLEQQLAAPQNDISTQSFSERLAYDYALVLENDNNDDPLPQLLNTHAINAKVLQTLVVRPMFQRAVAYYRDYIANNGITFKMKAKILADTLLPTMGRLARDTEVSASARVELFKHLTNVAELMPAKNVGVSTGEGEGGFVLNLNIGGTGNNTQVNVHGEQPDLPVLRDNRPPIQPSQPQPITDVNVRSSSENEINTTDVIDNANESVSTMYPFNIIPHYDMSDYPTNKEIKTGWADSPRSV